MSVTLAKLRELDCGPRSIEEAQEFAVQSFRYMMMKLLLDGHLNLNDLKQKVGISKRKAKRLVLSHRDLHLQDISDWCFAFNVEPDIRILPNGFWNQP